MDTVGTEAELVNSSSPETERQQRYVSYDCSAGCPVEASLEIIGGKWKGLILYHLLDGPQRFNALKRAVGDVTQRTMTKQLRELEADGIILREVFPVVPPHVEYSLSEKGSSLAPIILALRDWGLAHALPKDAAGSGTEA